jgi:hypothetical protein
MALKTTSGFTTGLARPQQPQSQGTPYNPQQGQPFGAWSPQPGSQAVPGPIPGTTMFRPPMQPPSQAPAANQGQFGQRTPITQGPAPRPGGITQDQIMQRQFGDFWGQAQQMFPTMSPWQQQEMARFLKNQQQRQNQAMIDQARQAGMNQWHADQAAAGQNIKDIGPGYRTNAKNRRR